MTDYVKTTWRKMSLAGRLLAIISLSLVGTGLLAGIAIAQLGDSPDSLLDPDQDGFSNQTEAFFGTDPQDAASHPSLADNNHTNIIGYWPLATDAVEAFDSGLDGDAKNGADFVDDALVLDGKDDYINFGSDQTLRSTGSISYCVWVYPQPGWKSRRLLGKFAVEGNRREYACRVQKLNC